jgi:hypothetical protein
MTEENYNLFVQVSKILTDSDDCNTSCQVLKMAIKNDQTDIIDWFYLQRLKKMESREIAKEILKPNKVIGSAFQAIVDDDIGVKQIWTEEEWNFIGENASCSTLLYLLKLSNGYGNNYNDHYHNQFISKIFEYDRSDFFEYEYNYYYVPDVSSKEGRLKCQYFTEEVERYDTSFLIGMYNSRKIFLFFIENKLPVDDITLTDELITYSTRQGWGQDQLLENIKFYLDLLDNKMSPEVFDYCTFDSLELFKLIYSRVDINLKVENRKKDEENKHWFKKYAKVQSWTPEIVQWIFDHVSIHSLVTSSDFLLSQDYESDHHKSDHHKDRTEEVKKRLKNAEYLETLIILLQNLRTLNDHFNFTKLVLSENDQIFRLLVRGCITVDFGSNKCREIIVGKKKKVEIYFDKRTEFKEIILTKIETVKNEISSFEFILSNYFPSSLSNLILLFF